MDIRMDVYLIYKLLFRLERPSIHSKVLHYPHWSTFLSNFIYAALTDYISTMTYSYELLWVFTQVISVKDLLRSYAKNEECIITSNTLRGFKSICMNLHKLKPVSTLICFDGFLCQAWSVPLNRVHVCI